jgi:uncharacterized protein (DUF1697 family)
VVVVSLLRGINLGPHHRIPMDALRVLYESLGLRDVRTHIVSGNVIFRTQVRSLDPLAKRVEEAIEKTFGFRAEVMLRTPEQLREVLARNPFAERTGIEPAKLAVLFLARDPGPEARRKVLALKVGPEEMFMEGRELYIYYPNGMGQSKLLPALLDRNLGTPSTARNWNTVTRLLALAEELEAN